MSEKYFSCKSADTDKRKKKKKKQGESNTVSIIWIHVVSVPVIISSTPPNPAMKIKSLWTEFIYRCSVNGKLPTSVCGVFIFSVLIVTVLILTYRLIVSNGFSSGSLILLSFIYLCLVITSVQHCLQYDIHRFSLQNRWQFTHLQTDRHYALKKETLMKTDFILFNFKYRAKRPQLPFPIWGCPSGVMVKAMDCRIVVREFVLQSRYCVHFRANTLGKGMIPLILQAMG